MILGSKAQRMKFPVQKVYIGRADMTFDPFIIISVIFRYEGFFTCPSGVLPIGNIYGYMRDSALRRECL